MNISTPEKPKAASPLKILLMGPPGSRKTTLGLQFPDVHVIDCDRNLDGPLKYLTSVNRQPSFTYDDIRDSGRAVENCYDAVIDSLKQFKVNDDYKKRRVVFLDSLSHVNEFIIRHVLRQQGKTSRPGEMEARDWGPFKSYAYNLLVGALEQTGKTVICSCHETKIFQANPRDMMNPIVSGVEPFFQGKVGETIGAFFTDVWRLEVQQAAGGLTKTILFAEKFAKCETVKNSLGITKELDVTDGYKVLEPHLKGRI
jgi:hypothetical protein